MIWNTVGAEGVSGWCDRYICNKTLCKRPGDQFQVIAIFFETLFLRSLLKVSVCLQYKAYLCSLWKLGSVLNGRKGNELILLGSSLLLTFQSVTESDCGMKAVALSNHVLCFGKPWLPCLLRSWCHSLPVAAKRLSRSFHPWALYSLQYNLNWRVLGASFPSLRAQSVWVHRAYAQQFKSTS